MTCARRSLPWRRMQGTPPCYGSGDAAHVKLSQRPWLQSRRPQVELYLNLITCGKGCWPHAACLLSFAQERWRSSTAEGNAGNAIL